MTQQEYDQETKTLYAEYDRRMDALYAQAANLHQAEVDYRQQQIEEWLSRQTDRLDRRFMEAA